MKKHHHDTKSSSKGSFVQVMDNHPTNARRKLPPCKPGLGCSVWCQMFVKLSKVGRLVVWRVSVKRTQTMAQVLTTLGKRWVPSGFL